MCFRPDWAALARGVFRVLKPGGVFCIIEHNPFNPAVQAIVRMLPMDRDAQLLTAGATRTLLRAERLAPVGLEYFLMMPEMLYGRWDESSKCYRTCRWPGSMLCSPANPWGSARFTSLRTM